MATEGFSADEWRQLRRIVDAGVNADVDSFKEELHNLDRAFPMSGRSGAYLCCSDRYPPGTRLPNGYRTATEATVPGGP